MYNIAIVEDDIPTNDEFKQYVKNLWPTSNPRQFFDFPTAQNAIANEEFDLIISDLDLGPGTDEYGAIKLAKILDLGQTPLLIVSGSPQSEIHRGIFRALQAWDYLQKPISEEDFRIQLERAIAFRKARSIKTTLPTPTKDPNLLLARNQVFWNGKEVHLPITQQNIVELLVNRADETVTFPDLYQLLKTGTNKDNVRQHLSKIRLAFQDVDLEFNSIKTITMLGYCWCSKK